MTALDKIQKKNACFVAMSQYAQGSISVIGGLNAHITVLFH